MIFSYERRGLPEGNEVFIFQDLLDSKQTLRELGKPLEELFSVKYIYLPEWQHWTRPIVLEKFKEAGRNELWPLLFETPMEKVMVASGFSFSFWNQVFLSNLNLFKRCFLFNPELDSSGRVGNFIEISQSFWKRQGFHFFEWLEIQPIAHHLATIQEKQKPIYPFPFTVFRSQPNSERFAKSSLLLQKNFTNLEINSLANTTWDGIKKSMAGKKLLLKTVCEEYKVKKDKIWSGLIKV
ncbi:hypothetical protein [Leptospira sp. GIMC2001]|uniref:hypothetical protein n=1 Tax=Leptospira sp. GIMC2001 TaxID=1513297 RepID=UPI00234AB836|nr:hypothetical protein [Leptospira sp. GIMC2001]WCL47840.1 hypothetical protein O4O04_10910 [Leptospira sp. GIMC2001]